MTTVAYMGIDVSKGHLDVGGVAGRSQRFANTPQGHALLVDYLSQKTEDVFIGIESTGIYSRPIADVLANRGYSVALIQPHRVRHFARSQGFLAKTDAIDVRIIAGYCAASPNLRLYTSQTQEKRAFRALMDRRDQLVEDRVREKCRLEACMDADVRRDLRQSIVRLEKAIERMNRKINTTIEADQQLAQQNALLQQVSGVAQQTSAVLLAHLPELGSVNRQRIAALVGLAPYNCDSGEVTGKRAIYGGRARVRRALYMATLTAQRHNPIIREAYLALLKKGKPKKVAMIACSRKLIVHLNALMSDFYDQFAKAGQPIST